MVQVSGVSRVKRRESGHGREEVGVEERMRGAFWERWRAVGGGMREGGVRRLACAMVVGWLFSGGVG